MIGFNARVHGMAPSAVDAPQEPQAAPEAVPALNDEPSADAPEAKDGDAPILSSTKRKVK